MSEKNINIFRGDWTGLEGQSVDPTGARYRGATFLSDMETVEWVEYGKSPHNSLEIV